LAVWRNDGQAKITLLCMKFSFIGKYAHLQRIHHCLAPQLRNLAWKIWVDSISGLRKHAKLCKFSEALRKNKMSEFLTTRELAALLRVKERKVYDLAGEGALPVRRVTGKLLFPRAEIEEWIASNGVAARDGAGEAVTVIARPLVIAGGHDPLLEWALRESRSGIAAFLDGALDGLDRAAQGGCIAAGVHLPENGGEAWNVGTIAKRFANDPVVLVEWAKRIRGLMFRADMGRMVESLADARGLRFQSRQPEAGSELVLSLLLKRAGMTAGDLGRVDAVERSETDLAMAIADGRADIGLGIEASARQFHLGFTPLIVERFDLLVWRKAYFDPPFQKLIRFCAGEPFKRRAETLGGYDIAQLGTVHFNGR
jgi:putative molybdopterin biosynthesis protein